MVRHQRRIFALNWCRVSSLRRQLLQLIGTHLQGIFGFGRPYVLLVLAIRAAVAAVVATSTGFAVAAAAALLLLRLAAQLSMNSVS